MDRDILNWFATGETGSSSKAMASAAAGIESRDRSFPLDPADLNRCIKLVARVPAIRQRFGAVAALSPEWAAIIANWDRLCATFHDEVGEDWSRGTKAPRTYALMHSLRD